MKSKRGMIVLISVIVLLLFIIVIIISGTTTKANATTPSSNSTFLTPSPDSKAIVPTTQVNLSSNSNQSFVSSGVPAIATNASVAKNATTNVAVPTFTDADVKSYISSQLYIGRRIISSSMQIEKIEFISKEELAKRFHGGSFNYPNDGRLFCYVTLTGTFTVTSPIPDKKGVHITSKRAFIIFDAYTGNQLGDGLLN